MKSTKKLHVTNRDDWRVWLRKNHDTEKEVWLICYKKHTGKPRVPYDDAVEEAICFGWIDSLVRRIDDEKFTRKFTPRKNRSRWSEANKKRARKMIQKGKMTKAGLAKIEDAEKSGEWFKKAPTRKELVISPELRRALESNKKALDNFNNLASNYKKNFIGWIASAKREETRKRCLTEAIRLLEQNKKLGMK